MVFSFISRLLWLLLACVNVYPMILSKFSLKQSINVPAMKMLGNIIKNPSLAVPSIEVNAISDLNIQKLKDNGVKCLVFDKDNTLCTSFTNELHASVVNKMDELRNAFPSMAILSNSVGSSDDVDYKGAKITESKLSIPVIKHLKKKPDCINEVLGHFRRDLPSIQPAEICMIGDRLLTDIVFGNQHNMYSVLVKPLNHFDDHPIAIVMRSIELYFILPILKACGVRRTQR